MIQDTCTSVLWAFWLLGSTFYTWHTANDQRAAVYITGQDLNYRQTFTLISQNKAFFSKKWIQPPKNMQWILVLCMSVWPMCPRVCGGPYLHRRKHVSNTVSILNISLSKASTYNDIVQLEWQYRCKVGCASRYSTCAVNGEWRFDSLHGQIYSLFSKRSILALGPLSPPNYRVTWFLHHG
jgi:hypothetical protein